MAIGGMHPVAHKKHWNFPLNDTRYPIGSVFKVEGDSSKMWIRDYNVRVCTNAEILDELLTKWENEGYTFGNLKEIPAIY